MQNTSRYLPLHDYLLSVTHVTYIMRSLKIWNKHEPNARKVRVSLIVTRVEGASLVVNEGIGTWGESHKETFFKINKVNASMSRVNVTGQRVIYKYFVHNCGPTSNSSDTAFRVRDSPSTYTYVNRYVWVTFEPLIGHEPFDICYQRESLRFFATDDARTAFLFFSCSLSFKSAKWKMVLRGGGLDTYLCENKTVDRVTVWSS